MKWLLQAQNRELPRPLDLGNGPTRERGDSVNASTPAAAGISPKKEKQMRETLLNMYVKFQGLRNGEEGQDLVEYALLVCLIALVCCASISGIASAVTTVFSNISSSLA
jgi:pilus assembly protein Flp/PilA